MSRANNEPKGRHEAYDGRQAGVNRANDEPKGRHEAYDGRQAGVTFGVLKRLARSAGAGAVASMVDLAVLTVLASGAGLGPRVASVPAFVAGGITMFFGQKYFAFRERKPVRREQVALFAVVQLVGLFINAVLYDLAMRIVPNTPAFYLAARMVTTNIVWLAYSFPVWHLVFRDPAAADRPTR